MISMKIFPILFQLKYCFRGISQYESDIIIHEEFFELNTSPRISFIFTLLSVVMIVNDHCLNSFYFLSPILKSRVLYCSEPYDY